MLPIHIHLILIKIMQEKCIKKNGKKQKKDGTKEKILNYYEDY